LAPCAPTRTPREILTLGAQALDRAPRIFALPLASLPVLGLGSPLLREMTEMRFLWDHAKEIEFDLTLSDKLRAALSDLFEAMQDP
jgi:hypothetical protein